MANRSYLYATDGVVTKPGEHVEKTGLSEYNYDLPLAFRLLVSQNPTLSYSAIWDCPTKIAIVGDFLAGRQKLFDFLDELMKIEEAAGCVMPDVAETKRYLTDPARVKQYAILECGELFMLGGAFEDEDADEEEEDDAKRFEKQNERLLKEIAETDKLASDFLAKIKKPELSDDEFNELLDSLGIGGWTEVLYYQ